MSETKGIDVSAWNGNIDWSAVADYGMGFAILRITEKNNIVDNTFEFNYKECKKNKIPVGVYKYSYATNLSQIIEEANIVISTLNQRNLDYPIFLDIEDECQENLSSDLMAKMIDTFNDIVIKAGYKFGIYCGEYWYKTKLPESAKKYDCWLSSYPNNDNGTLQERLRPSEGIGWQYSSKATIPGIPTKVDRNVFYKDYSCISQQEVKPMITKKQAINAMISIAKNEKGYCEKASNAYLDDKAKNAGYNNYTKYWRDIKESYQTQPWCAVFVTWVFVQAFGKETTQKLLKHYPYVYCPTLGDLFTRHANPQVGDIVIFYRNGEFAHTGIVISVNGDYFKTIEGNTSSSSGIVPNGGEVCEKGYYNSQLPGTKFCRPDYSIVTSISSGTTPSSNLAELKLGDTGLEVKALQESLIKLGYSCGSYGADGEFGSGTKSAVKKYQKEHNLTVNGVANKNTLESIKNQLSGSTNTSNTPQKLTFSIEEIKKGSVGNHVLLVQEILRARGFTGKNNKPLELDKEAGADTIEAIRKYQASRNGACGRKDGVADLKTLQDMIAL